MMPATQSGRTVFMSANEIVVRCTNGIKEAMLELAPAFERAQGTRLTVSYGSTKAIADEINAGAGADLAILTAEAIDGLVQQGKVKAGSRVDLARSGIGVAVRKGAPRPDISTPEAFKRALLAARKVTYSKLGVSGLYFVNTIVPRLGIAEEMKSRSLIPEPGTPVGTLVARGEADIALQQISELMPVAGIEIVGPLPGGLQKMTIFSAGLCAAANSPDAAQALAAYLAAPAAAPVFKKHGLEAA
jgi:molybdate transport system substrate-binding protein